MLSSVGGRYFGITNSKNIRSIGTLNVESENEWRKRAEGTEVELEKQWKWKVIDAAARAAIAGFTKPFQFEDN